MTDASIVAAAEIIRNFGYWQQQALLRPLTITHHGRARVMLVSAEAYGELSGEARDDAGEAARQAASGRLHAVLDNMAEGFVAYDAELKLRDMNSVAEAYYGRSRDELHGKDLQEVFATPSDEFVIEAFRRVLRSGEVLAFETSSRFFPGRRISARVFPYLDGVATLFTNITEQERLRAAAEDWDACIAALELQEDIGWAKLDGRGRVMQSGEGFSRLTGFSPETLASVRIFEIVANADRRRLQNMFEELMQGRRTSETSVKIVVKDGRERRAHFTLAPLVRDYAAQGALLVATGIGVAEAASQAA